MNPIKFIIVVSMVLLATDLIYHQVVNGQEFSNATNKEWWNTTSKEQTDKQIQEWWNDTTKVQNNTGTEIPTLPNIPSSCAIMETEHLVILDLNRIICYYPTEAIEHYSSLGYEIKAVESIKGDRTQHLMYMQKEIIK